MGARIVYLGCPCTRCSPRHDRDREMYACRNMHYLRGEQKIAHHYGLALGLGFILQKCFLHKVYW